MAELLEILSYSAFILSVVALALAVVFFIAFDIKAVVGELSGKTATEAIAKIREQGVTRKYKGRSLQSIVLEEGTDTGDFSLEKLALDGGADGTELGAAAGVAVGVAVAVSEAHTTFINEDSVALSEAHTTLMAEGEAAVSEAAVSEAHTTLIAEGEAAESEAPTSFLALEGSAANELETGLLSTDDEAV